MNIDGDIIISLTKTDEGLLISPRVRVYCKTNDDYQQIGLISSLKLETDVKTIPVDLKVALAPVYPGTSERVKEAIERNSELLKANGACIEDYCTCEFKDGAMGVDSKCPVHSLK